MLRGVNKKIIEISDTDNRYFEKAILYVRQGDWAPREIEEKAADFVRGVTEQAGSASSAQSATATKVRQDLRQLLHRSGLVLAIAAVAALVVFL